MRLIIQPLQRGFTLLEGLLSLSVLMGLLALGGHHIQGRLEEQFCQNAAAHLRIVADAAERYVLDHHGPRGEEKEKELWQGEQKQAAKAARQSLERWRYQRLIDKKYLPEGFNPKNLYGQRYALTVQPKTAPQPHQQLLVLTTEGQEIQERALQQIARQLGGRGGYISSIDKDPKNDFYITGSQRRWTLPLPPETTYQSPGGSKKAKPTQPIYPDPGHLASLSLLYEDGVLRGSTLLHRTAVPHQPQLNQMETDLVMQRHQIVFNQGQHSGTVNAQKLELSDKQPGGGLYPREIKIAMTPEKITFTGERLPAQWRHQVKTYSAPELHRHWNKLPYYELRQDINNSETEQFADEICATEVDDQWGKFSTMGRLFLLGFDQHPESRLYLCGHAPASSSIGAGPKAQLLHSINYPLSQRYIDLFKASNKNFVNLKDYVLDEFGISVDDKQLDAILNVLYRQPNKSQPK